MVTPAVALERLNWLNKRLLALERDFSRTPTKAIAEKALTLVATQKSFIRSVPEHEFNPIFVGYMNAANNLHLHWSVRLRSAR